ncbi:macro domain-containing protein [Paraliobacillus ryukyuensis]|uniref:macro domain-containing protein n=1 Tax=Paraliobacillus ryukyuensis TaxID=200904 RepID=UPI0009A74536|nr:macro domain-containing protein [Paraliobacillus ryukyuensis]
MKKYILIATDEFIYDRLKTEFNKFDNVEIHAGIFENLDNIDCLVSPANSFGLMNGGMDAAITRYFGNQLQERVQEYIMKEFYSEQPVGTSFIINTQNENIPYLAHTPTMRIPQDISKTENVYSAMRATLIETERHKNINTVAIPAFGHGAGRVHAKDVAYQMAKAFMQILAQPQILDWNYASDIAYALDN